MKRSNNSTKEEYNAYFREYNKMNREKKRKYNREYMRKWRFRKKVIKYIFF